MPPATETFSSDPTKQSPAVKSVAAVLTGVHVSVSSAVPLNPSTNVQWTECRRP